MKTEKNMNTTLNLIPDRVRKSNSFMFSKLLVIAEIEFKAYINNIKSSYGQLLEPIIYMVFLMAGLRGINQYVTIEDGSQVDFMQFALPGILAMMIIKFMAHTIYRSTIDKRWGLLALKFINGVSPLTYILGMTIYPAIMFLVQGTVVSLLLLLYGITFSVWNYILMMVIGLFCISFWCSLGIVITTRIDNYQQRDMLVGLLILPLIMTAPNFYSLYTAPTYSQVVAYFNPVTYQVSAMRSIF